MFTILVFFFKLSFSTFFSIMFSYFIIEEERDNLGVVLFGLLGTSLSLLVLQSENLYSGISLSILMCSIIYLSYIFFDISHEDKRLLFIFPGTIGVMVGFGLIFESILILVFLYLVKNNLNYIYETESNDIDMSKKQENDE